MWMGEEYKAELRYVCDPVYPGVAGVYHRVSFVVSVYSTFNLFLLVYPWSKELVMRWSRVVM